jgi:hydrogenase expression/formation protein HypE
MLVIMDIGKVPNDILNEIILGKIKTTRKEVLVRPKIGEDCAVIDFGEYACVMSSDPITGAVNEVGRLAVHVSCNDVASCGVEPLGLLVTILAPNGTTEKDLDIVMGQICDTAGSLNVDIIGGHTEITTSVNRFVIMSTSIGRALKGKVINTSGARPGNSIILTKSAGIEGTAIIAHDKEEILVAKLGIDLVSRAKSFMEQISVVKEGIIAGQFGATSMHDVTEGGVLGAIWEVAEASGVGAEIFKEKIPIEQETLKICDYFDINPLKLISSGCMLITCENGEGLVNRLIDNGIKAAIIGVITEDSSKTLRHGQVIEEILQPGSDELYKAV